MKKCNKCRTENFENCHSIKCPMRDVSFGKDSNIHCNKKDLLGHGGKRIGAGRKPIYTEETTTISFRVPKSLIEPITKYVKRALEKSKK